jgi:hypothetical protein
VSKSCEQLHLLFSSQKVFKFPFNPSKLPNNGIYILFEDGEFSHGTRRIVRVGTHTGRDQLRSRLRQHFMQENKDRSVFRKNIGRALLKKAEDPFLSQWELDLTTRIAREKYQEQIDNQYLASVEKMVSGYLQEHFSFAVFEIPDKETRLNLESKIISTVSKCEECKPSLTWLGLYSPKAKIRESGLWLVNELYKEPLNESEFESLKAYLGKVS